MQNTKTAAELLLFCTKQGKIQKLQQNFCLSVFSARPQTDSSRSNTEMLKLPSAEIKLEPSDVDDDNEELQTKYCIGILKNLNIPLGLLLVLVDSILNT